ncbi:MAG: hypothetical protein M9962_08440 [Oligoflexia bacterium]|nr:hypothetical protein [Oligoflexia bacterium]
MKIILVFACLLFLGVPQSVDAKEKNNRKPDSAHAPALLQGDKAKAMLKTLQDASGQELECGMGKCWITGEVRCETSTNAKENHFECEIYTDY